MSDSREDSEISSLAGAPSRVGTRDSLPELSHDEFKIRQLTRTRTNDSLPPIGDATESSSSSEEGQELEPQTDGEADDVARDVHGSDANAPLPESGLDLTA